MESPEQFDEGIDEPEDGPEIEFPIPFAAVTQTIRPSEVSLKQNLSSSEEDLSRRFDENVRRNSRKSTIVVDEFGFKIDMSKDPLPPPFYESVENRRNWLSCLEFSYTDRFGDSNNDISEDYTGEDSLWMRLFPRLSPSPRLTELIRGLEDKEHHVVRPKWSGVPSPTKELSPKDGIPHSMRCQIWPRLTRAFELQQQRQANSNDSLRIGHKKTPLTYAEVIRCSSSLSPKISRQIEKDLLRTMPNNACFSSPSAIGIPRLRRILTAVAWLYTEIGYCQGIGVIAANLLLFMEEEMTFYMMCAVIEDILPASYFSADSLLGVQADQSVLCQLISVFMPHLDAIIQQHDIDLPLITLGWFLTLFSGVLPMQITLRVWDLLFYEGSTVLFRIALAILKIKEDALVTTTNTANFFNEISNAPSSITDIVELITTAYSFEDEYLDQSYIDSLRRHHLSQLIVEISNIDNENGQVRPLPIQFLTKRDLEEQRYGGPLGIFCGAFGHWTTFFRPQEGEFEMNDIIHTEPSIATQEGPPLHDIDKRTRIEYYRQFEDLNRADPKIKNIRQTELLVNLRQAILAIVRHFHNNDPSHEKVSAQPDYSLASHGRDLTTYVQTAVVQNRRAKALQDFARQERDELGFLRNDIINVLDMHDEHCWLGEIPGSGLRGWFPAKLVELLDERSKRYSPAGDDSVYEAIGNLVRLGLCSTLRAIFEYGLKRTRGLSDQNSSPWKYIEEVAIREAERDSSSIHSRLILCRTFRLDEVGKVLSPEELLYRSIQNINASHSSSNTSDDVKFRTLVCIGLNELVLHLWLEILCSCDEVVTKWYHPWSFLRSPGWVQIKCELRVLSQFAFHLNPLAEVSDSVCKKGTSGGNDAEVRRLFRTAKAPLLLLSRLRLGGLRPLRDYQRPELDFGAFRYDFESTGDMLVKYHLFSWEL
ncbi:hypothetical protein Aperf_G00000047636 [Anoplocephala perfoliata]